MTDEDFHASHISYHQVDTLAIMCETIFSQCVLPVHRQLCFVRAHHFVFLKHLLGPYKGQLIAEHFSKSKIKKKD